MPSSVVRFFTYDAPTETLKVVFISGMVYAYKPVPEAIYLNMRNAYSKGKFLNENIKGKYSFEKIRSIR